MNLVLDTNVVIDWLVFDDAFLAGFREQVSTARITILTHQPAIDELQRVLGYPELKLDASRQVDVFARYLAQTHRIDNEPEIPPRFPRCKDPDDDHFFALAYHTKANALVSRDKAVLKLARKCRAFGFQVLTVPQMVAALESPASAAAADQTS